MTPAADGISAEPGATIDAARRALAQRFRDAGLDSPELDARLLLGGALGLDPTAVIVRSEARLTPAQQDAIEAFGRRRLAGEPVNRILGVQEFWGLRLELSPATLSPRPETETVVEAALAVLAATGPGAPRLADLGAGSGAIALALLHERPSATAVATDRSAEALRTARRNARAHGLESRIAFVCCDYAQALAGPFDLILSNPPYIRRGDIAGLAVEVRDHDPHLALDGGADGLDAYRAIVAGSKNLLAPGGWLVFEVGAGQAGDVIALMQAAGLAPAPPRPDLAGILRVTMARNPR